MGKGDTLAGGGRTAQFQQASNQSEIESDLKIQTREKVREKYALSEERYDELITLLRSGQPLPDLEPYHIAPVLQSFPPGTLEAIPDEPAEFESIKPKVGYKGKPFGDNVLVSRVDKEHTSNLIIPDSMKGKSEICFVNEIGAEVKKKNMKGGLVLVDKFATHGADIELIDEEGVQRTYLILREYDVLMGLKKVTLEPA